MSAEIVLRGHGMTKEKAGRITKQTLLPVGLVILLMKGSSWLTTTRDKTDFQEGRLNTIESKMDRFTEDQLKVLLSLEELRGDVRGIKGTVSRIESLTSQVSDPKLSHISAWRPQR